MLFLIIALWVLVGLHVLVILASSALRGTVSVRKYTPGFVVFQSMYALVVAVILGLAALSLATLL